MIPILRVRDKVTGKWVEIAVIKGDPGRGILSIERTKGDGSPGTTDEYTITYTDGGMTQFGVYNGKDGGTGTPSDLTAENIAEALGYTPANSADIAAKANRSGWEGNRYLGTDAAGNMVTRDAPAGEGGGSGTPGADGFSPIAKVEQLADGAKITITDATGTTEASVYNGKDGAPGADGKDGASVTVTNVTESTADGGENVVTFSDGTVVKIRNGSKGSAGKDGESGSDGEDGVSITSVEQTTTSEADGGTNVITVTLSNGQAFTFNIKNGSKGSTGSNGKDGTSITHSWDGTVLTVTSASGASSADLKGERGETGSPGAPGADGKDYVLTDADKTAIASQAAAQIDVSGKLDKSGGTMTGVLTAQNNTSYMTKQVRNVFLVADGESLPTGANGDICLVYTP